MSDKHHEEAHTGPIKTPKQLLAALLFAFVIPIFGFIGLALYVASGDKPAAGTVNLERAIAERIQKVGTLEVRDANRPLQNGEAVFKAQCAACHAAGVAGAPKLGDAAAWSARITAGFDALLQTALKGKGAMAPQGGGDFNDTEIGRAVVFMANAGGARFAEPAAPASSAEQAAQAPVAQAVPPAPASSPAPAAAAAPVAAAGGGAGEALYQQSCQVCHAAGVAGAPKFGDKAAWAARLPAGIDALYNSVVKGKGAMPPRAGTQASDADLRAAVEFMTAAVR